MTLVPGASKPGGVLGGGKEEEEPQTDLRKELAASLEATAPTSKVPGEETGVANRGDGADASSGLVRSPPAGVLPLLQTQPQVGYLGVFQIALLTAVSSRTSDGTKVARHSVTFSC